MVRGVAVVVVVARRSVVKRALNMEEDDIFVLGFGGVVERGWNRGLLGGRYWFSEMTVFDGLDDFGGFDGFDEVRRVSLLFSYVKSMVMKSRCQAGQASSC